MEETKSRRKTSTRKPLTDLSNTIPSSLPTFKSSSSLVKPQATSSLSLPLKSLHNNPNSKLDSKSWFTATESTNNDNVNNDKNKKDNSQSNKANPSSVLSPQPKTPPISVNFDGFSIFYGFLLDFRTGDCVDLEPCTVYQRRPTAEKRKSKWKEIAEPMPCSFKTRMPNLSKKRGGDGDIGLSKSCPPPRKRKQHRQKAEVNASNHDLPQDFIDKQRAYFAEVDAFELEEEVASADKLE
ncbi:hypothetical protein DITRI_Ditri18aG0012000 [Diplodiscus trichospermus]